MILKFLRVILWEILKLAVSICVTWCALRLFGVRSLWPSLIIGIVYFIVIKFFQGATRGYWKNSGTTAGGDTFRLRDEDFGDSDAQPEDVDPNEHRPAVPGEDDGREKPA